MHDIFHNEGGAVEIHRHRVNTKLARTAKSIMEREMRENPNDERLKPSVQEIGRLLGDPHPELAYDRLMKIAQDAADQGLIKPNDLSLEMRLMKWKNIFDPQLRRTFNIDSIEGQTQSEVDCETDVCS